MFLCGPIFVPVVTNSHATFLPGGKAAKQRFFAAPGGWWLEEAGAGGCHNARSDTLGQFKYCVIKILTLLDPTQYQ